MATTLILPGPQAGSGDTWAKMWKAYQADPIGGYATYYDYLAQKTGTVADQIGLSNFPAPGSAGAPTPSNPGGSGGSTPPGGGMADIMAPGGGPYTSRFGTYTLDPYVLGTGPTSAAAPVPAAPSPAPAPVASAPPGSDAGSGAGGTMVPPVVPPVVPPTAPGPTQGQSRGNRGGMLASGNAGGAQWADRGGMLGGSAGNATGGGMFGGSSAGAVGGSSGMPGGTGTGGWSQGEWSPIDPYGGIDIGSNGARLLGTAATLAPGWAGVGLGALQAGMRGYNTINTNTIRGSQGLPDTDFGQFLGGVLGLNNYGGLDGNRTIANPNQFTPLVNNRLTQLGPDATDMQYSPNSIAETLNGANYRDGPGGILGWVMRGLGLAGPDTPALSVKNTNDLLSPAPPQMFKPANTNLDGSQVSGNSGSGNASGVSSSAGGYGFVKGGNQSYDAASGTWGAPGSGTASGARDSSGTAHGGGGGNAGGSNNNGLGAPFGGAGGTTSSGQPAGDPSSGGYGWARGGYVGTPHGMLGGGMVPGRPDRMMDNRAIMANEGEFVVRNSAAKAAGRRLLGMLNTPAGAARLRGMLG